MRKLSYALLASTFMLTTLNCAYASSNNVNQTPQTSSSATVKILPKENGQIRIYDGMNVVIYKMTGTQEQLTQEKIESKIKHGNVLQKISFTEELNGHYIPVSSVIDGLNAFSTKPIQISTSDDSQHIATQTLSTTEVEGKKIIDGRIIDTINTSIHANINLHHDLGSNNEIVEAGLNAVSTDSAGEHHLVDAKESGTTTVLFKRHLGNADTESKIVWLPFTIHNSADKSPESYVIGVKLLSLPDPYDVQENYTQLRDQYKTLKQKTWPDIFDSNLGPKTPR